LGSKGEGGDAHAMSRSKILAEVEAMVFIRLFGNRPWLIDPETGARITEGMSQRPTGKRIGMVTLGRFGIWNGWRDTAPQS
jgi:hypothetical protein